jgi:hypothetical protein
MARLIPQKDLGNALQFAVHERGEIMERGFIALPPAL